MASGPPRLRTADGKLNQLGSRIKERRTQLNLTQDALCARLALATEGRWNADRMEIYRIETGQRIVSDLEILSLAQTLECRPSWLLLGTGLVMGPDDGT